MMLSAERRKSLALKAASLAGNLGEAAGYLNSRGISEEAAKMFQLGCVPRGQEYAGRLSIPYITPTGVVAIKYRCTIEEHGDHKAVSCVKYMSESGCGIHLYNARALIGEADTVVLTEGELDAIVVQAYCGFPAVAYPGVDTWKKQEHWRLCFDGVAEVVIIADGDKTGRDAASRVQQSLSTVAFLSARVVDMPDGMDANTFVAKHGANELARRITG